MAERRRASAPATIDADNVALFGETAAQWWDPQGPHRLLHRLNPVRLDFIRTAAIDHFGRDSRDRRPLAGLRALDVGCGGGLVTEPLARMGAETHGLDASPDSIAAARDHARAQGLSIRWHVGEVADLAARHAHGFDLITCLEVVEHVADVPAFLASLRSLLAAGGLLIFSTPNRTLQSLAIVKVGAEYVLRVVPRGAHDWRAFLTPAELSAQLEAAGFTVDAIRGLSWSPARGFRLSENRAITYIGAAIVKLGAG
jgi:2-polyprenyl-6-hydroxyphenyl methylase/3-demethylubiquinone-9 3-methyltransferase